MIDLTKYELKPIYKNNVLDHYGLVPKAEPAISVDIEPKQPAICVPKRWTAESGGYYIDLTGSNILLPMEVSEIAPSYPNEPLDYNQFKRRETAEAVAKAIGLMMEYLHTPIDYDRHVTAEKDMLGHFNEARKLCLEDDGYEQTALYGEALTSGEIADKLFVDEED